MNALSPGPICWSSPDDRGDQAQVQACRVNMMLDTIVSRFPMGRFVVCLDEIAKA